MAELVDDSSGIRIRGCGISTGDEDKEGSKSIESIEEDLANTPVDEEEQEDKQHDVDEQQDDETNLEEKDKQHVDEEKSDKQEDEEDFRVNRDCIPLLNGAQMKRGLPLTEQAALLNDPALHSAVKRFTTIKGFDFKKFIKKVVQTNKEFTPTTRIFGVVMLWNKRKKLHFFNDAYFSQKVFSDEIGAASFVDFLAMRGWSVTRRMKDGEIEIDPTYRRMDWLLQRARCRASPEENVCLRKYFQLMAMLKRVQKYLRSPGAFCPAQSSRILLLQQERQLEDQIKEAVAEELDGKKSREKNDRNVLEHRYLQLAFTTIQVCFDPVMRRVSHSDDGDTAVIDKQQAMERLFGLVFKECSTRRQLLEGLQDLLMFCKNKETIEDNKDTLVSWLNTPSDILTLARTQRETASPFVASGSYGCFLWESLKDKFRRSSVDHNGRSMERNRILVQVLVYLYINTMDEKHQGGISGLSTREVLLMGGSSGRKRPYRDIEVEDDGDDDSTSNGSSLPTSTKTPVRRATPPGHVVDALAALPSLLPPRNSQPGASAPQSGQASPLIPCDDEANEQEEVSSTQDGQEQSSTINDNPPAVESRRSKNTWSIPYDSARRWHKNAITEATIDQMRTVSARLMIECPNFVIRLYHRPMELYVAWQLHEFPHQFEVRKYARTASSEPFNQYRITVNIPDGGELLFVERYIAVARPGSEVFDKYFTDQIKLDLPAISQFIFKHGDRSDTRRSSTGAHVSKHTFASRYDFGNAGQASEPGYDPFRPKLLCNTGPLEKHEDLRLMLGRIVDAMCNCSNDLSATSVGRPYPNRNNKRYTEFASKLRDFIYADVSCVEWITLQLFNLSHYQGGKKHMDVSNDIREGYNRTMCFCYHFIDGVGDLWSLKIITSYRRKIGDHFSVPAAKLLLLKSALVLHMTTIDKGYRDILINQYNGRFVTSMPPTWQKPSLMWLDDHMPYDVKVLKGGVKKLFVFKMKTSPSLSYWLSPALTGAYLLSRFTSFRGMVQLALLAACQNSFDHFYVVTQDIYDDFSRRLACFDQYPMVTYCDTCDRLFHDQQSDMDSGLEFVGGDYTPPRYPPITFNVRKMFGSKDGTKKVDSLVDELISLIESVNTILSNPVLEICRSTLEPCLNLTRSRILAIDPNCDLGLFRLLIFLEFCAHLNLGLTMPNKKIRNLLYPVSGTASYHFISDHGAAEKNDTEVVVDEICVMLQSELSTPNRPVFMDEIEPMLGEAAKVLSWGGNDTFIKGQSLFRLDEHGAPLVKSYNDRLTWAPVPPYHEHDDD